MFLMATRFIYKLWSTNSPSYKIHWLRFHDYFISRKSFTWKYNYSISIMNLMIEGCFWIQICCNWKPSSHWSMWHSILIQWLNFNLQLGNSDLTRNKISQLQQFWIRVFSFVPFKSFTSRQFMDIHWNLSIGEFFLFLLEYWNKGRFEKCYKQT